VKTLAAKDPTVVDSLDNAPHPRETVRLIGHEAAEASFLSAYRGGRFPHAIILAGPEGIGKATFAYRAARFVMANPDPMAQAVQMAHTLDVAPDHPVTRRSLALSDPDLFVLRRQKPADRPSIPKEIPVSAARAAVRFFETTAGGGGWRVLIVDAADDLNRNSANSLLKAIEEPPNRALILMVSHAPGRLLPTIRSRCRMLNFQPLAESEIRAVLDQAGTAPDPALNARAAAVAEGSARMAFMRLDERMLAVVEHVTALLGTLPDIRREALHAMAETFSRKEGAADFETMVDTILSWLAELARNRAGEGAHRLAPLAEVWEKIGRAAREAGSLNLDRRALALIMFADLADAIRRSRAA
jgi:DNA polymerase-3 subunit delta'